MHDWPGGGGNGFCIETLDIYVTVSVSTSLVFSAPRTHHQVPACKPKWVKQTHGSHSGEKGAVV
eukprot:3994432-Pyramimonas_sp.AAC.1